MPFEFQCVYSVDHIFRKEKKKQREISYSLIANGGRKLAFGGAIPHCWSYYWWTCRGKGNGRHRHLWIVIFVSLFEDPLFFDNFILVYNVSWSHPLVSFTYVCVYVPHWDEKWALGLLQPESQAFSGPSVVVGGGRGGVGWGGWWDESSGPHDCTAGAQTRAPSLGPPRSHFLWDEYS